MGKLSCKRCGATAEGKTQAEADEKIDHAIGKMRGRPCSGLQSDLVWEGGKAKATEPAPTVEKVESTSTVESPKKKPKKSKRGN